MVGEIRFLLGWPIFWCYVSFRESNYQTLQKKTFETFDWICLKCLETLFFNIFSQMVVKNGDESHGRIR